MSQRFSFYLIVVALSVISLCQAGVSSSNQQGVTLETTGHGSWKPGRPFVFRIYSTSGGTKARVDYLTFDSRNEARQYLRTWLERKGKIIYRQDKKDTSGHIIGERIVVVRKESEKKAFVVIHVARLNYFIIRSSSLAAAIQVEEEAIED